MRTWFQKHEDTIVNHGSSFLIGLFAAFLAWVFFIIIGPLGMAIIFGVYVYQRSLLPATVERMTSDA